MKHWMIAAALVTAASMATADPAEGTWKPEASDEGGYLYVTIASCGNALCGTIAKAFDASNAASSDYEHLGKRMLWDMASDGDGAYSGGQIWAPDADKTYRSKMQLSGNSLEVKGCVAIICRGQTWTRVQ